MDVNWVTLASDQRYPHQIAPFLAAGRHSASLFEHTYLQSGYGEVAMGQLPVKPDGRLPRPVPQRAGAPPALVIGMTHDPWTPFAWARRLVADLGNARLLTFRGDGHDVLTSFDPCVVGAMLGLPRGGRASAARHGLPAHPALRRRAGRMRRRREQDEFPWYVWLAVAIDPLNAAYVLADAAPSVGHDAQESTDEPSSDPGRRRSSPPPRSRRPAIAPAAASTAALDTDPHHPGRRRERRARAAQPTASRNLEVDFGDDGTPDAAFKLRKVERIRVRAGGGDDAVRVDESSLAFSRPRAHDDRGRGRLRLPAPTTGPRTSERLRVSAKGTRVRVMRDAGCQAIDLGGVEQVRAATLRRRRHRDRRRYVGDRAAGRRRRPREREGGDGRRDRVILNATPGRDDPSVFAFAGVSVVGLPAFVHVDELRAHRSR